MDLRKVSETATRLVLEHDPVPGAVGFRTAPVVKGGVVQPGKWAHTWDGEATRHTFAPGFPPYTVEALMPGDRGIWPGAPQPVFGGNLAKPLPLPTGTPKIISTVGQLLDARNTGGLLAINGKLTLTGEAVFTAPVAFTSYNGGHRDGILCARNGSAGFKINAPRAWVHDLCLGGGLYDGVKLADGGNAGDVDIAGCLIRDCGEQGVNAGGNATDRIFVRECDMAQLGSRYPGDARYGHGIYTGGTAAKGWTIISNVFDVQAFAVQLYPNASGCVVAGNTCVRSATRGFATSYGPGHRFVGNVCHDGPNGGFIEGDGKAEAFGNVYWAMKGGYTNGYPKPPGDGGLAQRSVVDVVPNTQWGWLPPTFRDGTPRVTADAGATV